MSRGEKLRREETTGGEQRRGERQRERSRLGTGSPPRRVAVASNPRRKRVKGVKEEHRCVEQVFRRPAAPRNFGSLLNYGWSRWVLPYASLRPEYLRVARISRSYCPSTKLYVIAAEVRPENVLFFHLARVPGPATLPVERSRNFPPLRWSDISQRRGGHFFRKTKAVYVGTCGNSEEKNADRRYSGGARCSRLAVNMYGYVCL